MSKQSKELSHSQKELYKTCKRKWYYQYVEEKGIIEKSEALLLGEYVHSLIEQYLDVKYGVFGSCPLDTGFLTGLTLKDAPKELSQENIKLALTLATKGLLTLQKDYKEIVMFRGQPAIELKLTIEGFYTGIVDLIYIDKKGKTVLLDWKTTSWQGYTNHKVKTAQQLIGYAWLVEQYGVAIDRLAYGVLHKRDRSAQLMKVDHVRDYSVFLPETQTMRTNIRNSLGVQVGNTPGIRFLGNAESCFSYNTKCPFYDLCWSEDARRVEKITLVPNLL
jgi:hypothetical protein